MGLVNSQSPAETNPYIKELANIKKHPENNIKISKQKSTGEPLKYSSDETCVETRTNKINVESFR